MVASGDAIADLLVQGGVKRFYTVPGESFLEIIDGVDRHPDLRLISTRHESGASFMADADAKMSAQPAVVAATRAVGAANLAIGVHTAYQDSTPMVILLGQVDTAYLGREGFQEIDLVDFYRPITKWSVTAHRSDRIPELIAHALRVSTSGRPGPVMIAFPADVLGHDIDDAIVADGVRRIAMRRSTPAPAPTAIFEIADKLVAARKPVIIAGGGARSAREGLTRLAEQYQVGVYTAFRRQDTFPNNHDLYLGHLGLGVAGARLDALRDADLVVVMGSRLSEVTTLGYSLPSPESEVIQVDLAVDEIGAIVPVSLGVQADCGAVVAALLERQGSLSVPQRDYSAARRAFLDAAAVPPSRSSDGIDSARVVGAMREAFPDDTVVANDAGNFSAFLHQHWMYNSPLSEVAPTSGAMGYGLPAAIGAKLAAPGRTVVGVAGDGGFTMSAMELETAVREGVDITMVVFRNGYQGTIAMHQARQTGRLAGVKIGSMDLAGLARSLGAGGIRVDREEDLKPAFAEALELGGPVVVEVVTDPEVLSPTTRLSQLLKP
jgi:acetolactate synthase-1/2/3 large subunit